MARKTRYYYDEETCTFQEERLTPIRLTKKFLTIFSLSLVLAFGIVAVNFYLLNNPLTDGLKKTIDQQRAQIIKLNKTTKQFEKKMDLLHDQDNSFRSVLGMKEISDGVFNGGSGGDVDKIFAKGPEAIREAEKNLDILTNKIKLQEDSYKQLIFAAKNNKERMTHLPAIRPVKGNVISGFGMRMHPILGIRKRHTGIDLEASMGTPIHATADAVVKFAGAKSNGYGTHIDLDHGYGFVTKYAHLSKIDVKRGAKVKRGDVIGFSGNTGQSKGPHLHYEVEKDNRKVDPVNFIYKDYTPEGFLHLKKTVAKEGDIPEFESMD